MSYACKIDKNQFIGYGNYSILNFTFHPSYLCNISRCFMLSVIFFSLISNGPLYSCLDLTHINCFAVMRGVFNFLYKETINPIIFVIDYQILNVDVFL
jgi:hypothetical protein